jgi:hypothetical protein
MSEKTEADLIYRHLYSKSWEKGTKTEVDIWTLCALGNIEETLPGLNFSMKTEVPFRLRMSWGSRLNV